MVPLHKICCRYTQHTKTVTNAPPDVDGRGIVEIAGGTGYFSYLKSGMKNLRQHLVVKYKIVGIEVIVD
jgi:hypothetical protein